MKMSSLAIACLTVMLTAAEAPQPGDYERSQGDMYFRVGNIEQAQAFYLEALRSIPRDFEACCQLGLLLKGIDPAKAVECYSRAIQIDPARACDAYLGRGMCYLELDELDKALVDFGEAGLLNPQNTQVYLNRALVYMQRSDWPRAMDDYMKAIQLGTRDPAAFAGRAMVHLEQGNIYQAEHDFQEALRLSPMIPSRTCCGPATTPRHNEYDKALKDYSHALAESANPRDIFVERARLRIKQGNASEALAEYHKALQVDPNYVQGYLACTRSTSSKATKSSRP